MTSEPDTLTTPVAIGRPCPTRSRTSPSATNRQAAPRPPNTATSTMVIPGLPRAARRVGRRVVCHAGRRTGRHAGRRRRPATVTGCQPGTERHTAQAGGQAEHQRRRRVARGDPPRPACQQPLELEREAGEGREPAEHAGAQPEPHHPRPARLRGTPEQRLQQQPEQEGADHVLGQGTHRPAADLAHRSGQRGPRQRPDHAARGNRQHERGSQVGPGAHPRAMTPAWAWRHGPCDERVMATSSRRDPTGAGTQHPRRIASHRTTGYRRPRPQTRGARPWRSPRPPCAPRCARAPAVCRALALTRGDPPWPPALVPQTRPRKPAGHPGRYLSWRSRARHTEGLSHGTHLRRRHDPDRQHPAGPAEPAGRRDRDGGRQARVLQPRQLRQGPHRGLDHQRRRGLRLAAPGRHRGRGDVRQHRDRAGHGRRRTRLPRGAHHAGVDVEGAPRPAAGLRRRARAHAPVRRACRAP